jgi:hypothetical protein
VLLRAGAPQRLQSRQSFLGSRNAFLNRCITRDGFESRHRLSAALSPRRSGGLSDFNRSTNRSKNGRGSYNLPLRTKCFRAKDLKLSTTGPRTRLSQTSAISDNGRSPIMSQATTEATLCFTADAGRMAIPI